MNKNSRMTKAFQYPLFILSVILVCVSVVAVFLILNKYKSFESNQAKSGGILEAAHSDKTQSPMVQVNSPSPPQSTDTVNSISTQQALPLSQDNLSDQSGEVNTSLSMKDRQTETKKEATVSEVLSMLTRQPKYSNLSAEESAKKLATLLDKGASLKECRKAAWILAKEGDTKTLSALKQILADPTSAPDLKTAIVEGIAYSADPQKKEVFLSALNDQSEAVARAAIKGLAVIGDEDCVSVLSDIAWSPDESSNIRSEAIMSLGKIPDPAAYKSLVDLYGESASQNNADSQEKIITALGQRDIAETGAFFDQILKGKEADPTLRVAVAESLEGAQGDVSPFLVNMLHDEDSEVRAAAAWTLATREEPGNVSQEIQALLGTEADPEVRMRLYQAMGNQENINIDAVAPAILNESDPEARSAGYDLLAKSIGSSENADLKGQFDKAIVPELKETALTADKLNSRLGAIISLRRANTEQSYRALEEIAAQSKDSRVVQATGILK
jgi:HEAT repeat protein